MKFFADFSSSQKKKIAMLCVGIFFVGFFLGREQLKYQIRTSIQDAFSEFGEGLKNPFEGNTGADAKAKDKKKLQEQPLSISLLKKSLKTVGYRDVITFDLEIKNNLDKDVKAFMGTVTFYDLFDREIMPVTITYEDGVTAGATAKWEGSIDYNQFMDTHQRLAAIEFENVSVTSEIEQVIFTDGTKESY